MAVIAERNESRRSRARQTLRHDRQRLMLTYKKLDVYRCSIDLLALASGVLDSMRSSKGNAIIADQLKRAALSIPLNIGEGAGKSTPADQAKHYVIARGSAMECGAIFDAALVLRLLDAATAESSRPRTLGRRRLRAGRRIWSRGSSRC